MPRSCFYILFSTNRIQDPFERWLILGQVRYKMSLSVLFQKVLKNEDISKGREGSLTIHLWDNMNVKINSDGNESQPPE